MLFFNTKICCFLAVNTQNGMCLTEDEADPTNLSVVVYLTTQLFFSRIIFLTFLLIFCAVYLHSSKVLQEQQRRLCESRLSNMQ